MFCVKIRLFPKHNHCNSATFADNNQILVLSIAKKIKIFALISFVIIMSGYNVLAQKRITTPEYIETYKDIAIKKQKEYGIPASITLAQGILESGSGNSGLAQKANNHFGIKCHKGWTGKTYHMDDDAKDECFRKYKKAEDSYRDHSEFLTQRGRYSFLFDYKTTDYQKWAHGLKKAGYATNPKYPQLLIKIIEKYNLNQYDKNYKGKTSTKEPDKTKTPVTEKIIPISTDSFNQLDNWPSGRKVFENNGKKLIIIEKGDTFYGLADEFGIYSWQFGSYNELKKGHILQIGEIIYLQKKKRKAEKKYKYHIVKSGETLQHISQLYGIRLKKLYKMNNLPKGVQTEVGTKIRLR